MKTVLIVFSNVGNQPNISTESPSQTRKSCTPSLDILADGGAVCRFPAVAEGYEATPENILMSILGYDPHKGLPQLSDLAAYALESSASAAPFNTSYMVIPAFSNRGAVISTSLYGAGIGKLAFLDVVDLYTPGHTQEEIADEISRQAINLMPQYEFVLIYVDLTSSLSVNAEDESENKDPMEIIDSRIITPVADYVWRTSRPMIMAVTAIPSPSPQKQKIVTPMEAIVYYNDSPDTAGLIFPEKRTSERHATLDAPWQLIKYLSDFEDYITTIDK